MGHCLRSLLSTRMFYQQMLWLCKNGKLQPAYFSTLKVFGIKAPFNWQQLPPAESDSLKKHGPWRPFSTIT